MTLFMEIGCQVLICSVFNIRIPYLSFFWVRNPILGEQFLNNKFLCLLVELMTIVCFVNFFSAPIEMENDFAI